MVYIKRLYIIPTECQEKFCTLVDEPVDKFCSCMYHTFLSSLLLGVILKYVFADKLFTMIMTKIKVKLQSQIAKYRGSGDKERRFLIMLKIFVGIVLLCFSFGDYVQFAAPFAGAVIIAYELVQMRKMDESFNTAIVSAVAFAVYQLSLIHI